ncbi:MAG: spermidine synthase family protein [Planctomycetota bacterium]
MSAAILHLEILQTRIFSVMLWHHVTYLVVTFTLLGFGAAGAFVAVRPSMLKGDLPLKLTVHTALFGITTVGAFATLSLLELDTVNLLQNKFQYFLLFVYYLYLIVPYFFGGLVVVMLLSAMAKDVNRLYFTNLVGSGVGCLVFLPVIGPAGGSGSIMVVVAITLFGAFSFSLARERRGMATMVSGLLIIAAISGYFAADKIIPIEAAPSKVMSINVNKYGGQIAATKWDPLCRVDVVRGSKGGHLIYQDGDAPTALIDWHPDMQLPFDHYSLSYVNFEKPKVLIIGVGGGQDIVTALNRGASSITAAEINPSIYELMTNEFGDYTSNLYTDSGADVVIAEGRSFLRRSEETYDIIQMTGTDTYSALSSGSFVLSESYLYTLDAFDDYLGHLSENGVVGILRFRFYPPRECLRLLAIGAEALKRHGVEEPSKHIVVVSYHRELKGFEEYEDAKIAYAIMLFKMRPFTATEITLYEKFCTFLQTQSGGYTLSYAPGIGGEKEIVDLLTAADLGAQEAYYAHYRYDISPVSDDKPFFFAYHKWGTVFDKITAPDYRGVIGEDPVGLYILLSVLVESIVLVALLILVPLVLFRRKGLVVPCSGRIMFYFFCLGVSYLFIEIACMQKFILFLGHPTYSLSIVLFSFLLFSGFGSFFGQRFKDNPSRGIGLAVFMIAVFLVLYQFLLPEVFGYALRLDAPVRMAISVVLLAPLAFFMGIPFPLGIRVIDRHAPESVPWAFGINGGASVISSVVSVVLAMAAGFTTVFLIAGALYIMGWFFFRKLSLNTT